MNRAKKFVSFILIILIIAAASGCSRLSSISFGDSTLKVGVEGIKGAVNPFYCDNETDKKIISQVFGSIQREGNAGKLVNYCGGITYVEENGGVKYTVNIRDDLAFSDGSPVTIDDVIFFYHFIADATYDGIYSDWHLNDIQGLDAYYYDDPDYASAVANIEYDISANYTRSSITLDDFVKYLVSTKIEGEWSGDLNAKTPYGNTWAQQIDKAGYAEGLSDLGASPDASKLLTLVATMQAETNPGRYNPEQWWRDRLYSSYINKNYADGIGVPSISGIKKINDYACTVTYNSKNADAVSQINAIIVSSAFYSSEYRKGNAAAVKEITSTALGSGPYAIRELDTENGTVSLIANPYCNSRAGYDMVEFIDLAAKGKDPVESLRDGSVDVIEIDATHQAVDTLTADDIYISIGDSESYASFFFNTATLSLEQRSAFMKFNNYSQELGTAVGAYYTALYLPVNSVLFDGISANENMSSYPYGSSQAQETTTQPQTTAADDNDDSDASAQPQATSQSASASNIKMYYSSSCDAAAMAVISAFEKKVESTGVTVTVYAVSDAQLALAVAAGSADIWFGETNDNVAGDKYESYYSHGRLNYTGVSDKTLDSLLVKSHTSLNTKDRREYAPELLSRATQLAFELPLYQRKVITAYRTDVIDTESIPEAAETCGLKYAIGMLVPKK